MAYMLVELRSRFGLRCDAKVALANCSLGLLGHHHLQPETYRVQRQLYTVLLFVAAGLAVAVCLRPQMAEELMSLVRAWGPDTPKQAFAGPPTTSTAPRWDPSNGSIPGGIQDPAAEQSAWPGSLGYRSERSTTGDRRPWSPTPPTPPDRRPAPALSSDSPVETRLPANVSENRLTGYATADGSGSFTGPNATGTPKAGIDSYPLAGHQYPADRTVDYRPSGEVGNRPGAGSRPPVSDLSGMRYDEAGVNRQPSSDSSLSHQGPRVFEPSQPAFPSRDKDLARSEPRPELNAGLCETAQIFARVGSDIILAGEVLPLIEQAMESNKDKIPESQWEMTRKTLIRQAIESRVQFKLICADVKRTLPPEGLEHVEGLFADRFEEHEIPDRLKKANLTSRLDLERELEKIGSSIKREKRLYIERNLALKWVDENVRSTEEITHDDMLGYYREHREGFSHPARARWEQLSVRLSTHPNRADAIDALAKMGNQVLDGRPFADIAKEFSEGATARDGGARDWTTQASLRSKELDRAVFALPVGKLSQIIEDQQGFHIIRVTERENQSRTPFVDAQVQIKEKISMARRQQRFEEFTERLKREIPIWTVFDDQTADSRWAENGESPMR